MTCSTSFSPPSSSFTPPPPPCHPRTGHAYAAVISACAAGGQWLRAVSLFDEMLAQGVKPDVVSCTALITARGADGQWERSEKVCVCVGGWGGWGGGVEYGPKCTHVYLYASRFVGVSM